MAAVFASVRYLHISAHFSNRYLIIDDFLVTLQKLKLKVQLAALILGFVRPPDGGKSSMNQPCRLQT